MKRSASQAATQPAEDYVLSFTANRAVYLEAPKVVFTDPGAGSTSVALDAKLTIAFSEVMDPATVNTTNITMTDTDGKAVPGSVVYLGYLAFFSPTLPLEPLTRYTVKIGNGVKDIEGRSLWGDYAWTFTTLMHV